MEQDYHRILSAMLFRLDTVVCGDVHGETQCCGGRGSAVKALSGEAVIEGWRSWARVCEAVDIETNTRKESPNVGLITEVASSSLFRDGDSVSYHS